MLLVGPQALAVRRSSPGPLKSFQRADGVTVIVADTKAATRASFARDAIVAPTGGASTMLFVHGQPDGTFGVGGEGDSIPASQIGALLRKTTPRGSTVRLYSCFGLDGVKNLPRGYRYQAARGAIGMQDPTRPVEFGVGNPPVRPIRWKTVDKRGR
jgi:hypothetical protein